MTGHHEARTGRVQPCEARRSTARVAWSSRKELRELDPGACGDGNPHHHHASQEGRHPLAFPTSSPRVNLAHVGPPQTTQMSAACVSSRTGGDRQRWLAQARRKRIACDVVTALAEHLRRAGNKALTRSSRSADPEAPSQRASAARVSGRRFGRPAIPSGGTDLMDCGAGGPATGCHRATAAVAVPAAHPDS